MDRKNALLKSVTRIMDAYGISRHAWSLRNRGTKPIGVDIVVNSEIHHVGIPRVMIGTSQDEAFETAIQHKLDILIRRNHSKT